MAAGQGPNIGTKKTPNIVSRIFDKVGRTTVAGVEEIGVCGALVWETLFWVVMGARLKQPVRMASLFVQMMEVGIKAIPIVAVMAGTIGIMLAIQGIHTLKIFGAESRVVVGIAFAVVREFAPLITGIIVAGRTGSALAARLGSMKINEEIAALKVMGINPVRYLVAPTLISCMIMVPALTFMSIIVGLWSAGMYVNLELGISMAAYTDQTLDLLSVDDLMHGLGKSAIFAVLIAIIGVVNGISVQGGAEGVGKVTTRAVVQCISAIVVTDMVFAFMTTR